MIKEIAESFFAEDVQTTLNKLSKINENSICDTLLQVADWIENQSQVPCFLIIDDVDTPFVNSLTAQQPKIIQVLQIVDFVTVLCKSFLSANKKRRLASAGIVDCMSKNEFVLVNNIYSR